jgi:hypothetical protein
MWKQAKTTNANCEGVSVLVIEPCTFKVSVDVLANK